MRLRLLQSIQLALYLKVPKTWTVFKIVYDLSPARSSSPSTSSPFPLPKQPVWKLPTQTGTTVTAARSSKQYSPVQKAVPLHKFIFYITSGEQEKERKKERERTAVRAINVSWNLSHPCYNWQDKKDTVIKIQITGYCLGVLYIKILGWIIALQKCVSLFSSISVSGKT